MSERQSRRVVIAPDSFKGSITAADAAHALAAGWRDVEPAAEIVLRPMADGGEGTVAAFASAVPGAKRMPVTVDGPAGMPVETAWLLLPSTAEAPGGTAVIDMASTSGIEMLVELRPLAADSSGFGQAIEAALDHGVSRLVLGIGSSASTDGGTGMLRALGARFLSSSGAEVAPGARGLPDIARVDLGGLRRADEVRVLTDVTNPLTGPRGAATVFGPQKGLTDAADQQRTDAALAHLAKLLDLDAQAPGAGAAGGVGGALIAWGATLAPGAGEVAHLIGLSDAIAGADVVITGEGAYDGQSGDGKVPSYVASLAADASAEPMLAAGRIDEDSDTGIFTSSVSLTELAGSGASALADPAHWLREAGAVLARRR
ncbi:glycerate kinase [Microbacterium sp. H1-D42]|uniref:glycerate kinase n=1 Tax=Microbacterium sp. H1-D42 TaxID=2925844 RepID=UPI001F53CBE7|nr:glycerate kinase [Microbacterium sp. H1-D42]UNK71402.1 glycerate kinase [Microbacterium sp. H1-D42]